MSSRQAEKTIAREKRLAAEAQAQRVHKRKRLLHLGIAIAIPAIIIVIAIVATSGGGGGSTNASDKSPAKGVSEVSQRFAGIPQNGITLGKASAPITLVEFADLKCPVCKEFAISSLPTIVKDYVRAGKVKMQLRFQGFVGEDLNPGDSKRAAYFALAAAKQNKVWPFMDLFYINQKDEATRYVTDGFLSRMARGVAGLNVAKAMKDRNSKDIAKEFSRSEQLFTDSGFNGTPSFLIGKTGGKLETLNYTNPADPNEFTSAINSLLKS